MAPRINQPEASMILGVMPLTPEDETQLREANARLNLERDKYHAAIIQAHKNGASVRDIAAVLDVSHGTVHTIIRTHS